MRGVDLRHSTRSAGYSVKLKKTKKKINAHRREVEQYRTANDLFSFLHSGKQRGKGVKLSFAFQKVVGIYIESSYKYIESTTIAVIGSGMIFRNNPLHPAAKNFLNRVK